jgi:hypothetical protein
MAATIFLPRFCDLADAIDEELRHRARRREHVCGSPLRPNKRHHMASRQTTNGVAIEKGFTSDNV